MACLELGVTCGYCPTRIFLCVPYALFGTDVGYDDVRCPGFCTTRKGISNEYAGHIKRDLRPWIQKGVEAFHAEWGYFPATTVPPNNAGTALRPYSLLYCPVGVCAIGEVWRRLGLMGADCRRVRNFSYGLKQGETKCNELNEDGLQVKSQRAKVKGQKSNAAVACTATSNRSITAATGQMRLLYTWLILIRRSVDSEGTAK
eukprot:2205946-Rhodomonas_salina.2